MNRDNYSSLRRQFLSLGVTGAIVGTAGCTGMLNVEDQSESENDDSGTPSTDIDAANFTFEYYSEAQQVEITFNGGAGIVASNLQVRHGSGKEIIWAELGSTTAGPDEEISSGATAVLGPNILNWELPIEEDEMVRLVYVGKETPATLERYSPPETTDSETTVPASISSFSIESRSDQRLQISFTASQQLSTIQVDISGPETTTLSASDFTEALFGEDTYSYEATYEASSDGEFTATLVEAIDINGSNSTNNQSISDTTTISSEDTTPPSLSAFSIANPSEQQLRVSFDSNEQLSTIRVRINGPESVTLTRTGFSEINSDNSTYTYEATYEAGSDGEYTATLTEATDATGNDGATGMEVSITIETSSTSNPETLISDDFEDDHGMDPYEIYTNEASVYDWGTESSDAPDGGSYHGYIMEGSDGQGTRVTAVSNETVLWDRSYSFEFLFRSPDYPEETQWNKNAIGWRGHREGSFDHQLGLRIFDTDGSRNDEPFKWIGSGIVDSSSGHDIDWQQNVWYKIKGYVDEEEGNAEAKIWDVSKQEPNKYQMSANVDTDVAEELPFYIRATTNNGNELTLDVAYLLWRSDSQQTD